jgi:hypothetical protein
MSWSTDFEELLPQGVTVKGLSSISTDGYGTPVYSAGTTYKARISGAQEVVTDFTGNEQVASHVVWVASTSTFGPDAQFVLSNGDTPVLLKTAAIPDEDGIHHVKLWFGRR